MKIYYPVQRARFSFLLWPRKNQENPKTVLFKICFIFIYTYVILVKSYFRIRHQNLTNLPLFIRATYSINLIFLYLTTSVIFKELKKYKFGHCVVLTSFLHTSFIFVHTRRIRVFLSTLFSDTLIPCSHCIYRLSISSV